MTHIAASTQPHRAQSDLSTRRAPEIGRIGMSKDDLDTPVLVLDLDTFERNTRAIAGFLATHATAWRPHAKVHKAPDLALRQLAMGAIGVTCAKVGEAEAMVAGGVLDILVANQLGSHRKWERVATLEQSARVISCVDNPTHVEMADRAAVSQGVVIPLLVEVDLGLRRSGVASAADALDLAKRIERSPSLHFEGLMGYEGHTQDAWPMPEKELAVRGAIQTLLDAADHLRQAGIAVSTVSCGGTGSYMISGAIDGVTEIQAGGGCFMDRLYREVCHVDLEYALTLVATVGSRPTPMTATVDAGWKSMSLHHYRPMPLQDGLEVGRLSAEHGELLIGPGGPQLRIGDRVEFIPGYSDSTDVLHNRFFGIRGGVVEEVFEMTGRGQLT